MLAGRPAIVDVAALAPGLHIVATPIGNLGDITLRALETLAGADLIACEDTRVTRKLLDRYGIATPLTPYHEHNAAKARPMLLRRLAEGAAIALVSDAGTPLISDPGFKLVRAAQDAGHAVTALPGASAVLAALTVAGLADRSVFVRRLSAAEASRAARAHRRTRPHPGDAGSVRNRPAPCRDARRSCRRAWAARGRVLPRADQAARGDPPRRTRDAGAKAMPANEPRGEIVVVVAPPQAAAQPSAGRYRHAAARRRWRACR